MSNFIKIRGADQVLAKLREIERKVAGKIVRKELRDVCKRFAAESSRRAPKRTGFMSREVKTRAARRKRGRIGMQVQIGARGNFKGDAFYGGFIHFGWRVGRRRPKSTLKRLARAIFGDRRRQIAGRPFMEEGFKAVAPTESQRMPYRIWNAIAALGVAAGSIKR